MLQSLYIKDFILIDQLNLEFHDGFSVFTGETGAGKSIFIDAISTLTGARMNTSMIRPGAEKAIVEGQLAVNQTLAQRLAEAGYDSSEMIVTREIDVTGKSTTRVNQRLATASFLRQCLEDLIDIHCQNDNQYLLNERYHRRLVDEYAGLDGQLTQLHTLYDTMADIDRRKERLLATSYNPAQLQMMEYQLKELQEAKLQVGEDEQISQRLGELSNFEKTQEAFNGFKELMSDEVLDKLYEASRLLEKLPNNKSVESAMDDFKSSYYNLKEDTDGIVSFFDESTYDQQEVDDLNARLFLLQNLKRKYASDIPGLLEQMTQIQKQLDDFGDKETVMSQLQAQRDAAYAAYEKMALDIRRQRQKAAGSLREEIEAQVRQLNLENAHFEAVITPSEPGPSGMDDVRFMISMNKGQPLQPLNKVASGGELSRLMLGLKTIFNRLHGTRLVIFDEIDAGVSGYVAFNIGAKMKAIADDCQVFTVTHLAAVAAHAQYHYRIAKSQTADLTRTDVLPLDDQQRLCELAVLSSSDTSPAALKAAKELRQRALDQDGR